MDQSTAALTPNSYIKTMSIIHLGLLAGPFVLGIIAYLQTERPFLDYTNTEDVFIYVVPVFAISGIFMGNLLFKKLMASATKTDGLRTKLARFQTASLIKYALIEGPALLGAVVFLNSGNLTYLYIAGTLILFLYLLRPTKDKIELGLQLKGEEKAQFNRLDEPIP